MSEKLHVRDFLPVAIPILLDAGWSQATIRDWTADVQALMGDGGTTLEWLTAMGTAIAATGDKRAEAAFMEAFERWSA